MAVDVSGYDGYSKEQLRQERERLRAREENLQAQRRLAQEDLDRTRTLLTELDQRLAQDDVAILEQLPAGTVLRYNYEPGHRLDDSRYALKEPNGLWYRLWRGDPFHAAGMTKEISGLDLHVVTGWAELALGVDRPQEEVRRETHE